MTINYYEPKYLRGSISKILPERLFFRNRFFSESVTFPTKLLRLSLPAIPADYFPTQANTPAAYQLTAIRIRPNPSQHHYCPDHEQLPLTHWL